MAQKRGFSTTSTPPPSKTATATASVIWKVSAQTALRQKPGREHHLAQPRLPERIRGRRLRHHRFLPDRPRFGTNSQLVQLVPQALTWASASVWISWRATSGQTSVVPSVVRSRSGTAIQRLLYLGDSKDSFPTKKFVRSDAARDSNYMKNFFDIQPALNYGYLHPDPAQPWQQGVRRSGPHGRTQRIEEHHLVLDGQGRRRLPLRHGPKVWSRATTSSTRVRCACGMSCAAGSKRNIPKES